LEYESLAWQVRRYTAYAVSNLQNNENKSPEFDQFAPAYSELLDDPIRNRFSTDPLHFHRRKWLLLQSLLRRAGVAPQTLRWLDVGCGQGELLSLAGSHFASAQGCDPSAGMLSPNASVKTYVQPSLVELPFENGSVDFVTVVCVYHHVHGPARAQLTDEIKRVLTGRGLCCIIEHNPWNPVTRTIVKRCAVDVDAELLTTPQARKMLQSSGFHSFTTDYFLYFPESIFHRFATVEKGFRKLPLGGQYALLARAPE
jgi:SAM-dependent methyltransferase